MSESDGGGALVRIALGGGPVDAALSSPPPPASPLAGFLPLGWTVAFLPAPSRRG